MSTKMLFQDLDLLLPLDHLYPWAKIIRMPRLLPDVREEHYTEFSSSFIGFMSPYQVLWA